MRNTRVVLFVLCLSLLAACGGRVYDVDLLETTIQDAAEEAFPQFSPFTVECGDVPAPSADASFTCTATDVEGDSFDAIVTGLDDQGEVDIEFDV